MPEMKDSPAWIHPVKEGEKMNRNMFTSIIMAFCLLMVVVTGAGNTVADVSYHYSTLEGEYLVNETVLYDYYGPQGDSRVDDYMLEDFDDSTYEFIDGISATKANGMYHHITTTTGEYLGEGALYINSTDSASTFNPSSVARPFIYIDNSTLTDSVWAWEFDFMLEQDTEPMSMEFGIGGGFLYLNLSATTTTITSYYTGLTPDQGSTHYYNVSNGVWNHAIISIVDNIIDGFEMTVFINNASAIFNDNKQSLTTTSGLSTIGFYATTATTGNDRGRDLIFDNLVMYNGSFNSTEILRALTLTYTETLISSMIPLIITVSVFGMIIAVVGKLRF
jgi:hypothetical protein